MKVKTITVLRVKNFGNYQTERLEMMAELDEGEEEEEAALTLREKVKYCLTQKLADELIDSYSEL